MVLFQPQESPWMLTAGRSLFFLALGAHFLNGAVSTASTESCVVILKKITLKIEHCQHLPGHGHTATAAMDF